jgi:5-methylthioribose kinase
MDYPFDPKTMILDLLSRRLPGFRMQGKPQTLSGGLMNYVWRVSGNSKIGTRSLIVKWSPPFIASLPEVALDQKRSQIEAKVLSSFEPEADLSDVVENGVRPPYLYLFDEHQHFVVMEDIGRWPDLGTWLRSGAHSEAEAQSIGTSLGSFIGKLHRLSAQNPKLTHDFDNREIQLTRLNFQYKNIAQYALNAGLPDASELGRQAVAYGEKLQQPGVALIMGDLWPASIIIADRGLRIIDWEFAHYGRPSQDVGHLVAHLWMHHHRAKNAESAMLAQQILLSFLEVYRSTLGADFEALFGSGGVRESSIHFGSELLTRTTGAFQQGFLYDGLPIDSPIIQEAAQIAAQHLIAPTSVDTWNSLGWRRTNKG